ncbi:SMC5-SMC6 complex localization factor protein 2 [Syngnathus scovelli]|uniref:SMC5-SMC6 complex localization factor protein 2 n=1 Tax=Syngnathus scovelli TaxID=161590 RepID=UPI0021102CBA|nr:SMC5-SMC6 complex localization factor protein 2 [Syngnathus scovelli]
MTITNAYFTFKMKNGPENKGDTWICKNAEYCSPRIKESPMKPSQIANRLVPPPRRMLPLDSSPLQPSARLTPICSSESNRPEHRMLLSGLQRSFVPRPQPPVTGAKKHDGAQVHRPSICRAESSHRKTDFSPHFLSPHKGREHKSMAAVFSCSSSVHKLLSIKELSSEKSIPAMSVDHASQKRHRESEENDASVKKTCVRAEPPTPKTPTRTFPTSPHSSKQPAIPNERLSCSEPSSNCKAAAQTKPTVTKQTFLGARQLQIYSNHSNVIRLGSFSKQDPFKLAGCDKRDKTNADVQPKHSKPVHRSPPRQSQHSSFDSSLKTTKCKHPHSPHESPSKLNGSLSTPPAKRKKIHHRSRTVPNDYDQLFTPDVILRPVLKTTKNKTDETEERPPRCDPAVQSSENSCRKGEDAGGTCPAKVPISSKHLHISLPYCYVSLVRLSIKSIVAKSKDRDVPRSCGHSTHESLKHDDKNKDERSSTSPRSRSPPTNRSNEREPPEDKVDSLDEDLDLSLGIAFDLESSHTSRSSDEEDELPSLQEIMNRVRKDPASPDKGDVFSEPSTPAVSDNTSKAPNVRRSSYRNSLDQILKEMDTQKKAKENEAQLRTSCDEELLSVAEYHEQEENRNDCSSEQQEFLQRYSLNSSCAIRETPPGEVAFHLDKFGQIFNQDSLQLRQCTAKPQNTAEKTLLWSSPAQLKLHVNIGLFQDAYCSHSPCPTQITNFLFKMMSVHPERLLSEKMLQALCDIANSAASNIVKNQSHVFTVWVPALADVTLALMNMGVAFVTLFPFENLQPAFTEGDLLKNISIQGECPPHNKEWNTFPEHNCNNILKYLSYCFSLCPKAYSDYELLLLLTLMARVALDPNFIPMAGVEINKLLNKIVKNIRDWDTMIPRMCQALTELTDDHHNMCLLVQLLPDNTRGKCLRRHLSLSMISKLLDGTCRYRPTGSEFKLTALKPYVAAMPPSSLRRFFRNTSSRSSTEEDLTFLDQQSYYLCYSLLTLTNEASNFRSFPTHQKAHLLALSSDLRAHVMCRMRESETCLYRSKVKDLLARIDTKWQMILHRMQPLNSKLRDYWKPSTVRTSTCTNHQDSSSGLCTGSEELVEEKAEEEASNDLASPEQDAPQSTETGATSQELEANHTSDTDAQTNSCRQDNTNEEL